MREHCLSIVRRFGLGFIREHAFPSLGNMTLDGFVGGRALLGRDSEGESWPI